MKDLLKRLVQRFKDIFEDFFFEKPDYLEEIKNIDEESWNLKISPSGGDDLISFFNYKLRFVKETIHEIKYHRNNTLLEKIITPVADSLNSILEEKIGFLETQKIILLPVPSHKSRILEKGFSHTKDIVVSLRKKLLFDSDIENELLVKNKITKPQTNLSRSERLKNIKGSFKVNKQKIKTGVLYIVVDDVLTTGTTLNEARKILSNSGVKNILCIALARG